MPLPNEKPGYQFDDPHCHHLKLRNQGNRGRNIVEFQRWLQSLFQKRVSRCAVTDWGENTPDYVLRFDDLVGLVEDYNSVPLETSISSSFLSRQYTLEQLGERLLRVTKHGAFWMEPGEDEATLLLYRAQEIFPEGHNHISAIGSKITHENGKDPKQTLDEIFEHGAAAAILEHPCTRNFPLLQYWFTNARQNNATMDLLLHGVKHGGAFGVEVFNGTNHLWMKYSNILAEKLVRHFSALTELTVRRVAASDNHYSRRNYGTAGLWFPEDDLSEIEDEQEFFDSLSLDLMDGKTKMRREYTRVDEFAKYMVAYPLLDRLAKKHPSWGGVFDEFWTPALDLK